MKFKQVILSGVLIVITGILFMPSHAGEEVSMSYCGNGASTTCPLDYAPVCGYRDSLRPRTFANGCHACNDPDVIGYVDGRCT